MFFNGSACSYHVLSQEARTTIKRNLIVFVTENYMVGKVTAQQKCIRQEIYPTLTLCKY